MNETKRGGEVRFGSMAGYRDKKAKSKSGSNPDGWKARRKDEVDLMYGLGKVLLSTIGGSQYKIKLVIQCIFL